MYYKSGTNERTYVRAQTEEKKLAVVVIVLFSLWLDFKAFHCCRRSVNLFTSSKTFSPILFVQTSCGVGNSTISLFSTRFRCCCCCCCCCCFGESNFIIKPSSLRRELREGLAPRKSYEYWKLAFQIASAKSTKNVIWIVHHFLKSREINWHDQGSYKSFHDGWKKWNT